MFQWLLKYFKKRQWPKPAMPEIRSRSRILVIDDQDFVYESLFRRDGYNITKWDDVLDLEKLETGAFEVILLDIQGVGKALSSRQGLGVLEHIRAKNPAQIIIAYSGDDYKLDKQSFFDKADAKLGKSQDYLEYKRCVDEQLKKAYSIHHYLTLVSG